MEKDEDSYLNGILIVSI